jgi:hypothetical protein
MIDRTLAALFLAGTATLARMMNGCSRQEPPSPPAAASTAAAETLAATRGATTEPCAADDIECEERLYQLEETLFAYEETISKRIASDAQACWKFDRDTFRRSVDECTSVECKEAALLARISSLQYLQPEAQRASLTLPETPLLLAVLAPVSEETTAAPPDRKPDLDLRGGLVHASEHIDHMGIAVSVDGRDHVFIFDMDISGGPAQDEVLGLVGTSPTKQIWVRGYSQVAPSGVANFDPAQCRWVYEL